MGDNASSVASCLDCCECCSLIVEASLFFGASPEPFVCADRPSIVLDTAPATFGATGIMYEGD